MKPRPILVTVIAVGLSVGSTSTVVSQAEVSEPLIERAISYAQDDPKQVIHAFMHEPRGEARPALAIVHGGGLVWGEPELEEPLARRYHGQGYVTFLVGYRLFGEDSGENPWPAQLDDVQRAMRWIRAHASEYDVDPERVCALGFSSGGHLTAMLGTTDVTTDADPVLDGIPSRADCVVSLAGDGDLLIPFGNEWDAIFERLIGGTRTDRPGLWRAASPAQNVDDDTVPFFIVHGVEDTDTVVESARALVAALTAAEREVVYAELPTDHFGIRDDDLTWDLVDAFLAKHLELGR